MFKENGRLTPAENVEIAKLKEKTYRCENCGKEVILNEVEFAAVMFCESCGGILESI